MLDKLDKEIDAVAVSTPDHTHFPIAMAAMELGKHVFVQKPLAHNIWQVRTLRKAAKRYGVVTQMGNQGHTFEGMRRIKEWVDAGVIGDVTEVVTWTNRPNDPWFIPPRSFPPETMCPPADLDWDLWQGPVAAREYSRAYVPVTVARLVGLRLRLAGRHRLPHLRRAVLGAGPGGADQGPGGSGSRRRRRLHFDGLGGDLPVPGPRRETAGDADMVREGLRRAEAPALGPEQAAARRGRDVHGRNEGDPLPRRDAPGEPDAHPGGAFHGDEGGAAKHREAAIGGRWPDRGMVPGDQGRGPRARLQLRLRGAAHRDGAARRPGAAHRPTIEWDAEAMRVKGQPDLDPLIKEPAGDGWRYGESLA